MSVNNVPLGMSEVPEDSNALTIYALDKSGVWLDAMTLRVDLAEIAAENWEQPLRLAVCAAKYQMPE